MPSHIVSIMDVAWQISANLLEVLDIIGNYFQPLNFKALWSQKLYFR
jgi:hypothetical protein